MRFVSYGNHLSANMGGTEMYKPFDWIFKLPAVKGYLRQIFILTDGEIDNTDQVISLVRQNSHQARVFALGLGSSASHHLVEGIARAGNGTALFASLNEQLEPKIVQQLNDALQPALTEVTIEWGDNVFAKKKQTAIQNVKSLLGYGKPIASEENQLDGMFRQAPNKCPPVFDGHHLVVYAMLNDNAQIPETVTLIASSPVGPLSVKLQVNVKYETGEMIHRLAAKKLIQDLHDADAETHKKEIIDLGCRYGLASNYTSYVAVDSKARELGDSWMIMKSRDVPVNLPDEWMDSGWSCSAKSKRSFGAHGKSRAMSACQKQPTESFRGQPSSVARSCKSPQFYPGVSRDKSRKQSIDGLQKIISIQCFDGSFKMDAKLAHLLNSTLDDIEEAVPDIFGAHCLELLPQINSLWATVLSLAYMKLVLANRKDSWYLVAAKAEKWLNTLSWTNLDVAKEAAENYVKSKLQL